jgi:hypothetical protein
MPNPLTDERKEPIERRMDYLLLRQSLRLNPPTLTREEPNDPAECRCNYCGNNPIEYFIEPFRYGGVTKGMLEKAINIRARRCVRYVYLVTPTEKKNETN